jgi:hypothetical protein
MANLEALTSKLKMSFGSDDKEKAEPTPENEANV